jgi:CSLREA domain-containing protein
LAFPGSVASAATLSGRVYEGQTGVEPPGATPLEGVTVTLYGSNNAGQQGAYIRSTTTDSTGWYGLEAERGFEFYSIVETDPAGYTSVGATTVDGSVISSNWIQYAYPLDGKTLTGNKFWDKLPGPVNQPPMAVDDSYSVAPGGSLYVGAPGVLSNDSDPDGDPLTAVLNAGPSNGTVQLNSDGSFSYSPNVGFSGTDSFTYKANDGALNSNIATVTIEVLAEELCTITVYKWEDKNGDGVWDPGEQGLGNWKICLDDNQNCQCDPGETFTLTDGTGMCWFDVPCGGTYYLAEELQPGWERTCPKTPPCEVHIHTTMPQNVHMVWFGNRKEQPSANQAPVVEAGPDRIIACPSLPYRYPLAGYVRDDGLPEWGTPWYAWTLVEGPDTVDLAEPDASPDLHEPTGVEVWSAGTFHAYGRYVLLLTAGDGDLEGRDETVVDLLPTDPPRCHVVNTTADHDDGRCEPLPIGDCTLREAMRLSNELKGPDTIVFEIPVEDPGYDPDTGRWTITPTSDLPVIEDGWTTIDGGENPCESKDLRISAGPSPCAYFQTIVVNFASPGTTGGFIASGANGSLENLIIHGNDYGPAVSIPGASAYNNVVRCNFIEGNWASYSYHLWEGVKILNGAHDNLIENNLIGGSSIGVYLTVGAHHNSVTANGIGQVAAPMNPNTASGVAIDAGSHHNTIGHASDPSAGNVISGNQGSGNLGWGVTIGGQGTDWNVVANNRIGIEAGTLQPLANQKDGVLLTQSAWWNTIGPGNIIACNNGDGVAFAPVSVGGIMTWPGHNVVTWNSIFDNGLKGIRNPRLAPPAITIDYVAWNRVDGETTPAVAGGTVEIFENPAPAPGLSVQGKTPIGKTTTQADGSWSWSGPVTKSTWLTATVTASGDTSEFSSPVQAPNGPSVVVFTGKTCPEWMLVTECLKGITVELWTQNNESWKKATDTTSDEDGDFTLSYENTAEPQLAYRLVMADARYRVVRAESASGGETPPDGSIVFSSIEAGVYAGNLFYLEPRL